MEFLQLFDWNAILSFLSLKNIYSSALVQLHTFHLAISTMPNIEFVTLQSY